MLYLLTDTNTILTFDAPGARAKSLLLCHCACCDCACTQCAPEATCPHDSDGHSSGLCISKPNADGSWERIQWLPRFRQIVDCACPADPCEHKTTIIQKQMQHKRGVRPAGSHAQKTGPHALPAHVLERLQEHPHG